MEVRLMAKAADAGESEPEFADEGVALLHLGCGRDYREGWHNVDVSEDVQTDEVVDLKETPWPWADDSFTHICAEHVLEHLAPVPWDEIVRVLSPGGSLALVYPIGHTRFEDPTHRQFWNIYTAETLGGERAHSHEFVDGLNLQHQEVDWELSAGGILLRSWVRWRLYRDGTGPWLGQIPGVYGEVTAEYWYNP